MAKVALIVLVAGLLPAHAYRIGAKQIDLSVAETVGKKDKAGAGAKGSTEALPVVFANLRKIPTDPTKREVYMNAHQAATDYMMANNPGTKAAFQSTDKSDESMVHDFQFFNSVQSFFGHADMNNPQMMQRIMAWVQAYDSSYKFTGSVFGSWTPEVVKMTKMIGDAQFTFVEKLCGYIKQDGAGLEGPPVIVSSKRTVLPGKIENLKTRMQAMADYYYEHVPGVLAVTAGVDPDDPNLVHDLQIFANWEAFLAHMNPKDAQLQKLLFEWVDFKNVYDSSVPFYGEAWVPKAHLEEFVQATTHMGAQFTPYVIEDVHGNVDFGNGDVPEVEEKVNIGPLFSDSYFRAHNGKMYKCCVKAGGAEPAKVQDVTDGGKSAPKNNWGLYSCWHRDDCDCMFGDNWYTFDTDKSFDDDEPSPPKTCDVKLSEFAQATNMNLDYLQTFLKEYNQAHGA